MAFTVCAQWLRSEYLSLADRLQQMLVFRIFMVSLIKTWLCKHFFF